MKPRTQYKALTKKKSFGTATTEFVITLAFFVPVFVTVPMIGKYGNYKQKNIEANRYAVWERTVWSGPENPANPNTNKGTWNDGENVKTDVTLSTEVDNRFYGSQLQGIASSKTTDNPLWVDISGNKMIAQPKKGQTRITVSASEAVSPIKNTLVDNLAYKGVPVLGSVFGTVSKVANATIGKFVSGCKDLPGVDLKKGMNLGSKTYSSITVLAPIKDMVPTTNNVNIRRASLTFAASGSILSNAWTAPTEGKYRERVDKLVIDETVECITSPARLISIFPVYKEGKAAKNVASGASSTVLLPAYKK